MRSLHPPKSGSKVRAGAVLALAAAAGAAFAVLFSRSDSRPSPASHSQSDRSWAKRSLTVEVRGAEELREVWRNPEKLRRILARFAEIEVQSAELSRWRSGGQSWTMRQDESADGSIRWLPDSDAPVRHFDISFQNATGQKGTVVTLALELNPPGGAFGRINSKLFGGAASSAVAISVLHAFKALVETGEIPTTDNQPAARRDPR